MPNLINSLRSERLLRGWSQTAVAEGSGLSRAAISAIERGNTAPSAAAALALARLFGTNVEALFQLESDPAGTTWAWQAPSHRIASWSATIGAQSLRFPLESTANGLPAPDDSTDPACFPADRTIVIGGCDPAVGILASYLARDGFRLLPFSRSSGQALGLLGQGLVHGAGVHLDDNRAAVLDRLGEGYCLLHVARWDQGLSLMRGLDLSSVDAAIRANLRWVGREPGSGARHCLDRILEGHPRPWGYEREARDHGAVAQTIATGWAQAGVCVRLTAQQAGLEFLSIQQEAYELVLPSQFLDEARGKALLAILRSASFRRQLAAASGYDTSHTGELDRVSAGTGVVS